MAEDETIHYHYIPVYVRRNGKWMGPLMLSLVVIVLLVALRRR